MNRSLLITLIFIIIISGVSAAPFTRLIELNFTGNVTGPYTAASNYTGNGVAKLEAWHLFDTLLGNGNPNTGSFQSSSAVGGWVNLDLGSGNATAVTAYNLSIWLYNVSRNYDPIQWKVESSNDNATWVPLNNQSTTAWTNGEKPRQFNFTNTVAYRYWRITFLSTAGDNSSVGLGEWMLLRDMNGSVNTITLSLNNTVNGTSWPTSVLLSNLTGTLTFTYYNITNNGFCVSYTGNGTGGNCTTTGSGTGIFLNQTVSQAITGNNAVGVSTHQGFINLSAYRLFLNTTILSFNSTNNLWYNTTSTGSLLLPALNGSNNLNVNVSGNYTMNVSCTITTLFSTEQCNATGIYDNRFTIGASRNGAGLTSFTVNVTNTTLGNPYLHNQSTTNGSIVFSLLQGYTYLFSINATDATLTSSSLPANASTNMYNFSLLTSNTFELRFFNETSNTLLTNINITVQFISESYATNSTTSNGTLIVSLLTPDDYTIRYWYELDVPRDYYVTLTPQSYQNLSLYLIDSSISTLYVPVLQDQNGNPVSDATIKLLRYYILTGNTGEYRIVEMTKTDNNGQGVLRVVPNIINYKFIMVKDTTTFTSTPTKLTDSTNTYTINTQSSPITSMASINDITNTLVYNNATGTFVLTWSDDQNLVTQGCLTVKKTGSTGTITTALDQCTSGATGSIIYTITDTNQTQYSASSVLYTNTEFSTYSNSAFADFRTKYQTWGLTGVFLTLLVFLVFSFMGAGSTDTVVLFGVGAIILMSLFGVIFGNYGSIIGILIVVGIIMYKTKNGG
jgi:hypothetical protein